MNKKIKSIWIFSVCLITTFSFLTFTYTETKAADENQKAKRAKVCEGKDDYTPPSRSGRSGRSGKSGKSGTSGSSRRRQKTQQE